jgi:hypothetical protein
MSNKSIILSSIAIVFTFILTSCVTTGLKQDYGFLATIEDSNVFVTIAIHNETDVEIQIENNSNQPISVDWDSFAYKTPFGESKRLIHSGVRLIDRNQAQSKNTVPAKGRITDMLVASDAIGYTTGRYGGWSTYPWIAIPPENCSFTIAYIIGNELTFLDCAFTKEVVDRIRGNKIGEVKVEDIFWHVFFYANSEKDRQDLLNKAQTTALEKYGQNVRIINPRFNSSWHIASLLLYVSMLGWVETANVTKDVITQ